MISPLPEHGFSAHPIDTPIKEMGALIFSLFFSRQKEEMEALLMRLL
jgi:hypothetical protein